MTGLAALSYVTLKPGEKRRVRDVYFPWAVRAGAECEGLINVWWERELEGDVGELRRRVGLEMPPDMRALRKAERARGKAGGDGGAKGEGEGTKEGKGEGKPVPVQAPVS